MAIISLHTFAWDPPVIIVWFYLFWFILRFSCFNLPSILTHFLNHSIFKIIVTGNMNPDTFKRYRCPKAGI
ncbi:hypothetical protein BDV36DRAFT_269601 [Aspergillus pseudocaelatus]|uniref:Uncharacterized protein n=1 Tax=Aspergillus pseudocaelatus TaxID=1825620 RepID=A0ABQ6WC73_9EURO|nr:hypothetical protein BDV36DRAFT_269601 [Aspergillus pseudocaelatus]